MSGRKRIAEFADLASLADDVAMKGRDGSMKLDFGRPCLVSAACLPRANGSTRNT